jgi:hypothetical protein
MAGMPHTHEFYTKLARVLNTGKSRSVLLAGNVYDLFFDGDDWVPLVDFLSKKCALKATEKNRGVTQIIYEVNRPVRLLDDDGGALAHAWNDFKGVSLADKKNDFDNLCNQTQENPTFAMEFLRQLTICSRKQKLKNDLLIIIEGAEMLLPPGNYAGLQFADRKRISIMLDWFSDPKFTAGHDSVIMLAESRSMIHPMISSLPQMISVEVPAPNLADRQKFSTDRVGKPVFAEMTAGLTLQAYRQLLCDDNVDAAAVIEKVEEYIASQLGEDVVEFKRPTHTLKDVRGFTDIKNYVGSELIPRFKATGEEALPGAGIAGPIGGGKTFIMEAMASELGMPVLVLKNIRSQWFGQTDVILERLRRVLIALEKVCIFADEADTLFGGLGSETHETERRLTGKIQAMMSDPTLRGKVIWLLMTARIHRLSADIRRPGRVGDLIIPILDPEGEDRKEFIRWLASAATDFNNFKEAMDSGRSTMYGSIDKATAGYSAAAFAALRSKVKAKKLNLMGLLGEAEDTLQADIGDVRRYQILQALLNCTSKKLIPKQFIPEDKDFDSLRAKWRLEVQELERKGID